MQKGNYYNGMCNRKGDETFKMNGSQQDEHHVLLKNIKKCYGKRTVLNEITLDIRKGEFIAVVGKSGCGKSTFLRLIAGLESFDGGMIQIDHQSLVGLNHKARMMFQDGRLLPWKRVIDNVCLGLSTGDRSKAMDVLENVGLKDRRNDWPSQLSGGQQQRVALARALVHDPSLLLLDEPLGALDALTRMEMHNIIERLWLDSGLTTILVTHDVEEAVTLADRVILIENGTICFDQAIDLPRPDTSEFFNIFGKSVGSNYESSTIDPSGIINTLMDRRFSVSYRRGGCDIENNSTEVRVIYKHFFRTIKCINE